MIQIVDFEPVHIHLIRPREHEKERMELMGGEQLENVINLYVNCSKSFTVLINGEILGVGGVLKLWEGVGEIWLFTSELFDTNKLIALRTMKKLLNTKYADFHRIQATVKSDFKRANDLVKWLGFKNEGTMEAYGIDGCNYTRYARITR